MLPIYHRNLLCCRLANGNTMLSFLKPAPGEPLERNSRQTRCEERRRRRRLQLESRPAGKRGGETAWDAEWRTRIECWWMGLPMPTQARLGGCLGALALHLGSRLDTALGRPPQSAAAPLAAEAGCEWLAQREEALQLPEFPKLEFPKLDFGVPPLPRLVPSWEELQALGAAADPSLDASGWRAGGRGGHLSSWGAPTQQGGGPLNAHSQAAWTRLAVSSCAGVTFGGTAALVLIIGLRAARRRSGGAAGGGAMPFAARSARVASL